MNYSLQIQYELSVYLILSSSSTHYWCHLKKKNFCKKNETLRQGNGAWFATPVGELAVTSLYEGYPEIKNKKENE